MDRLNSFVNTVHGFFAHFEGHIAEIEEVLKEASDFCSSLPDHSAVLQAILVTNSLDGTGLEQLPGFREHFINSSLSYMSDVLDKLNDTRNEILKFANELFEKYKRVEQSFNQLKESSFNYSAVINPVSPRLEYMVDWCLDVWRYYHSFVLQVTAALDDVNLEDDNSVNCIVAAFKQDKVLRREITRIRKFELHLFEFIQ